jgi:hypothetical protein
MEKKVFNLRKLSCAALLAAMVTLSSCLDGGSNKISDTVVGIVRLDTKTFKNVLDVSAYESFYSPAFSNMDEGACCHIYYELDYEDPNNTSEMLAANGYYTVTVLDKVEIDKYHMTPGADTSLTALPEETPIIDPTYQVFGYVKGIVFITHQLNRSQDQRTNWELSYNWNKPSQNDEGDNVYDVYLRAKIRVADSKTPEEGFESCAYDMKEFLESAAQIEKGLGKSKVIIRFHYVSDIKDGTATWSRNPGDLEFDVAMIIPETATGY